MFKPLHRGALLKGRMSLAPRHIIHGLRTRKNGSEILSVGSPGQLVEPPWKRARYLSTNVTKIALPTSLAQSRAAEATSASASSAVTVAVAAAAAALVTSMVFALQSNEEESGETSTRTNIRTIGRTDLMTRPIVRCTSYRRRIQDMYDLVDNPVGAGAFGVVCAGVHKVTGELVAVKQIPRRLTQPTKLQSEVDLLRLAGQHSNVVNFRDLFSDEDSFYIVMEFATGGELFDRLVQKGAHSEHDAACLIREVTDALAYLHGNDVVHFDIKPENILLQSSDTDSLDVKLVDFGSAFVVGPKGVGIPRENSGTIAYSAPEVLRGQPFGTAADMWSTGVVLYILLCGAHPFDLEGGAKDAEVRRRVLAGDVSFENPVWEGKDGAISLIKQLLEVDPNLRPTANEVLKHPWIGERAKLSRRPMTGAAENLRVFHRGRMRLKACLLAVMTGLAGPDAYIDPTATVGSRRQALKFMDVGLKGYISADDLRRALRLLGEDLRDEELTHMMQASTGRPGEQDAPLILYNNFMKLVPPLCPSHVFEAGDTIYSAGAMDRNFFLINQGEVALEVEGCASKRCQSAFPTTHEPGASAPNRNRDDNIVVTLQRLGRGDSFGEGELIAAAEAQEGEMALAAALSAPVTGGQGTRAGMEGGDRPASAPSTPRGYAPGEGPGRATAWAGGVHRAARAVCVSEACEVMAVPRHLFANLLDELGGVRRKLELQAKSRASDALMRLIDEGLLTSYEGKYSTNDDIWPPPLSLSTLGAVQAGGEVGFLGGSEAFSEALRVRRREAATVFLVREGSIAVTQGGLTRTVRAGEVCVCGVPRRGISPVTRVACSPQEREATVVSVPLKSLWQGGVFTPDSLDSFLRLLSVGYGLSDASFVTSAGTASRAAKGTPASPWEGGNGELQRGQGGGAGGVGG
ncbi:unnamed protein product, partial [Ascophyllum nodosum]